MLNTSAMFVALPSEEDSINDISTEDVAHVSLTFFGDASGLPEALVADLEVCIRDAAGMGGAFSAQVAGSAQLGPDKASVLLLESSELVDIYQYLKGVECVQQAEALADKQFPWWIPHITIGYGTPILEDPPSSIQIGALGFWQADEKESFPLSTPDLTASLCIPTIDCCDDLSLGLRYASAVPAARWYVVKRARALGMSDRVPAQWSTA